MAADTLSSNVVVQSAVPPVIFVYVPEDAAKVAALDCPSTFPVSSNKTTSSLKDGIFIVNLT